MQIIGILKEHQAGRFIADLCHKHDISDATLIIGAKCCGMRLTALTNGSKRLVNKPQRILTAQSVANVSEPAAMKVVHGAAPETVREVPIAHDIGPLLQVSVAAWNNGQFGRGVTL